MVVLFGGDSPPDSRANDTWELSGTAWTRANTAVSPPGRANIDQALAYDAARTRTVLFGGLGDGGCRSGTYLDDTWVYDGQWRAISPSQSPEARMRHAITFDASRGVIVLFGGLGSGSTVLGDMWDFDGSGWSKLSPATAPPARHNHSMAYDRGRGVVVLFGGEDGAGTLLNDTWEYDGFTWRPAAGGIPTARKEMPLVYDEQGDRILFFGGGCWGGSGRNVANDWWQYVANPALALNPPAACQ